MFILVVLLFTVQVYGNSICNQTIVTGPCKAYFPRFAFDSDQGKCVDFVYGGCGGNANNFQTIAECQKKCESSEVCSMDIVPGPCRGSITRFAFDAKQGICVKFIYGGCGGNANNFECMEDCEKRCLAKSCIPKY